MLKKRKYKLLDLIRLSFYIAPIWTTILLVQQILGALMPALSVLVTANFIDTALAIVNQEQDSGAIYLPLFALTGIILYQWLMGDVRKYIDSRIIIATRRTYRIAIIEKRSRLEYRYIEDQETYDLIKRVTDSSDTQVINMFNETIGLVSTIVGAVSILLILMVNVWWAALAIVAFSMPVFYLGVKAGKSNYEAGRDVNKIERLAYYLTEVCSGRDPVDERTLFGYSPKMTALLWERFEVARKYKLKVERKNYIRMKAGGVLVSLVSAFVIIILLQPVASGAMTVGLFMSLVNACVNLTTNMSWGLAWQLSQLAKNREYLKDLTNFCALKETEGALEPRAIEMPIFERIEFRNVSFIYPGTKTRILNQVNFILEAGKHYAFVGVNGAGKTTIVKLLTGQYDNYEGEILLNGKNIKEIPSSELKNFFSVAYQDFARYSLTVKENMMMGTLHQPSLDKVNQAIIDLELEEMIAALPQGLDTPLGKIHQEGVDLSGGQWQRIALARTLINPAPIKILDEPTAALDPLSESHLYEQFEKMIHGKTTIFISHRLGSIKLADEILLFDDGKLVEFGNHSKLMAQSSHYSQMYQSQLKWYQNKEEQAR